LLDQGKVHWQGTVPQLSESRDETLRSFIA